MDGSGSPDILGKNLIPETALSVCQNGIGILP